MKKVLCAASLGIALAFSAGVQAADKIGVVNVGEIIQKLPAREAAVKQLDSEFKGRISELQSMEADMQTKVQKLQRDGSTMKASERTKLEKEVMAQRNDYAQKAQSLDNDSRRRQMEEQNKLLTRIHDAVKVVAGKEGYDVVLDANTVLYSVSGKDITADVLKQVK
ncbi:periplasmic molecular chaperone for outer membrane proteins [Xenorhabdus bovienii str. kraussei Quebec]|uniref:Chaperone protein Skp n=1 Tax=Xenorhabdus bovienii str. kraussei Quebec TaxID=1398203 RepID=A0A077PK94_XENBV|nr:molecular chaperone Skp [Xenorhabdus bovienii]MDE9485167.1 molecular chaperone Skp [Xenorhabdus bovienii]CDH21106.1 periplasmic molecular chaperone for outer membrane proteins [Xenorhabdus bovienii str. kraussei Quebec]